MVIWNLKNFDERNSAEETGSDCENGEYIITYIVLFVNSSIQFSKYRCHRFYKYKIISIDERINRNYII